MLLFFPFFCSFFLGFSLHFDLLFFCVAFLFYIFAHFFTNKLIFKFLGFWLTGEHKVNAMQLSFGMFKLGAMPDHTMKSGMPPAKRKENVTSTSV